MASLTWKGDRAYAIRYLGRVDGKQKFESHPLGKFRRKADGKIAFLEWLKWNDKLRGKKELFEIIADKYLEFCKATKAPTTYRGEEIDANLLKKEFPGMFLADIDGARVESYKRKHPTWKATTWRNRLSTLKKILNYARNHGFDVQDPFKTVRIPSPRLYEFQTRAVSIEILDQLLNVVPEPFKSVLGIMRYTGARPIEVSRIKQDDVDFERGTVRLFGKRKYRTIHVPPDALPYLKNVPIKFITTSLAHALKKTCTRENLPGVTPYMFRHSVATYLAQQKCTLREIQEFLGQSTPAITARYTTVEQESFVRLSGLLGKRGKEG